MTAPQQIRLSDVDAHPKPGSHLSFSCKKARCLGHTHKSKVPQKAPFTIIPAGETITVGKRRKIEFLDEDNDVLLFHTEAKSHVFGPAIVRITKNNKPAPSFWQRMAEPLEHMPVWGRGLAALVFVAFHLLALSGENTGPALGLGYFVVAIFGGLLAIYAHETAQRSHKWSIPPSRVQPAPAKDTAIAPEQPATNAAQADPVGTDTSPPTPHS